MTLQDILQIIGGVGVISSFVYAGLQVRRNTTALRSSTYQQLNQAIAAEWGDLARNADYCDLILRGSDDFAQLTRVEKARFRFSIMGYFKRYEVAYFQHNVGVLRESDWSAIGSDLDIMCSLPGIRSAWPLIRNRSNTDFRSFVDALMQRIPVEVRVVASPA